MRKDRWGWQAERYIGEVKKNEKGRKKRTRENKGTYHRARNQASAIQLNTGGKRKDRHTESKVKSPKAQGR